MRVIAGSARRLLLKSPEGLDTRPTTDRIKETLFNMLMPNLPDAVFIDLFSGSGGIGIEALSRGANKAYFVENNQKAVACITENLEHTHLSDRAVVLRQLLLIMWTRWVLWWRRANSTRQINMYLSKEIHNNRISGRNYIV